MINTPGAKKAKLEQAHQVRSVRFSPDVHSKHKQKVVYGGARSAAAHPNGNATFRRRRSYLCRAVGRAHSGREAEYGDVRKGVIGGEESNIGQK